VEGKGVVGVPRELVAAPEAEEVGGDDTPGWRQRNVSTGCGLVPVTGPDDSLM
jgi:hypothetical protein